MSNTIEVQPGTFVEAASMGLIPVATYTSGYSISYPRLVDPNNVEEWLKIVDFLQQVPEEELLRCQAANDLYLSYMHNWNEIENQILFYLGEFMQKEILGERKDGAKLAELY